MRVRQTVGIALVTAAVVVAIDLLMQTSLLRVLRPRITAPPDGAIVSGPVTVSWEGPPAMRATLSAGGERIDLGVRESPFEIDASRFPRPGQYAVEIASPLVGSLIGANRLFMVRRPSADATAAQVPAPPEASPREAPPAPATDPELLAERDRLRVDVAALQGEIDRLRGEAAGADEAIEALQTDADARLAALEAQRDALSRDLNAVLQENQALRARLESVPQCTTWGYLAGPRPQTSPPSRLVVVSDRRGNVFRSEAQCIATRRADPTGLTPCVCVGLVWE